MTQMPDDSAEVDRVEAAKEAMDHGKVHETDQVDDDEEIVKEIEDLKGNG
ncbi:MAG TPA: hypothetical protein VFD59_12005 [Nocardioidaceae bacterium]|nr:hypothetical protein [Nocardioidaceae bacterium]